MHYYFLVLGLLFFQFLFAQSESSEPNGIAMAVPSADTSVVLMASEVPPSFPGGQQEMLNFIATHVIYPDEAANQGITGKVYLKFVVNTDGGISDILILRSVHPLLDSASLDMLRKMPQWIPGNQNGSPARVQMVVPVSFSLQTLPPDKDSVYTIVQRMPSFPGGVSAMNHYIDTALKYPKMARANKIQGIVQVACLIGKDGTIEEAKVINPLGWRMDEEAIRIVQEMPRWNPGTVSGFPVRVRCTLAITFVIKELYNNDGTQYVEGDESLFSWRGAHRGIPGDSMNHTTYFPGGDDSMYYFIGKYLRYPEKARDFGVQGKVVVKFKVQEDGSLTAIAVHMTEHDMLNEEALRIVKIMPNWIPAKKNGQQVDSEFYLPINFKLVR